MLGQIAQALLAQGGKTRLESRTQLRALEQVMKSNRKPRAIPSIQKHAPERLLNPFEAGWARLFEANQITPGDDASPPRGVPCDPLIIQCEAAPASPAAKTRKIAAAVRPPIRKIAAAQVTRSNVWIWGTARLMIKPAKHSSKPPVSAKTAATPLSPSYRSTSIAPLPVSSNSAQIYSLPNTTYFATPAAPTGRRSIARGFQPLVS